MLPFFFFFFFFFFCFVLCDLDREQSPPHPGFVEPCFFLRRFSVRVWTKESLVPAVWQGELKLSVWFKFCLNSELGKPGGHLQPGASRPAGLSGLASPRQREGKRPQWHGHRFCTGEPMSKVFLDAFFSGFGSITGSFHLAEFLRIFCDF